MRNIIFFLLFIFPLGLFAQENCEGKAQVKSLYGIDIYLYSTPVVDYEETFKIEPLVNALGALGDTRQSLDEMVDMFARRCFKLNKKADKKDYEKADGIIIYNSSTAMGIRYLKEDDADG